MTVSLVLQVILDLGVLLWASDTKVIERFEGDNPRRDGGTKVLAEKGSEGDILPLLNVACRLIVEENQSKNVVLRLGRRDALAKRFTVEGDKGHFESKSRDGTGRKRGRFQLGTGLTHGAAQRGSADDDAGGPAAYPTGMCFQLGSRALSGSRNILPTFRAWSSLE